MKPTPAEIVTILEQLGGQQIFAMAFKFAAHSVEDGRNPQVTLHVARGLKVKSGIRWITIELDRATDTYSVKFLSWSRRSMHHVEHDDLYRSFVYADQLRAVVEGATGLRMTLGTLGGQAVRS